jgi:hypothetical protein
MKFDAWPVEQHEVGPAEPREMVGEAVADDAGPDEDGARLRGNGARGAGVVFHGRHLGIEHGRRP